MDYPKSVLEICTNAANAHDDAQPAIREAIAKIRAMPDFAQLVDLLVDGMVQELVYDARSQRNRVIRRSNNGGQQDTCGGHQNNGGGGHSTPQVNNASPAVIAVANSLYNLRIGGSILGDVYGRDLPGLADKERGVAATHSLNARLCTALGKLTRSEERVRDAVSPEKLARLYCKLQKAATAKA